MVGIYGRIVNRRINRSFTAVYKIKDDVVEIESGAVVCLEIKSILTCIKLNLVKIVNLESVPLAIEGSKGISEVYSLAVYRYPEVCSAPTGNECDTDLSLGCFFYVKLICNVGVTVTPVTDNCSAGCSFLIKDEGRIAVGGSTVGINRLNLDSITISDGRNLGSYNRSVTLALLCASRLCARSVKTLATFCTYVLTCMRRNNRCVATLYEIKDNIVEVEAGAIYTAKVDRVLACIKLNLVKVVNLERIPTV